ncbi:MAG: lysophospholipid acyltransferase family protein [Thermoguttaceae bacterium]|jgi:1-acyl-sn-glycerol-3-phosphate acyltransferase
MTARSRLQRIWYGLLKRLLFLAGVMFFRVRYFGRENIPATGGVLVVSNHQSHFDPPLVGAGCPRHMNYLARKTLFGFAPFRWLIRSLDAIPIDRDGIGLGGLKESLRRLKRGEMVLIFPEGTRSGDGQVAAFRPGFTVLASRSGSAILPVAIDGAFAVWPRWRKFPGLGTIHVYFGPPLMPREIAGRDERELVAEIQRRVEECHAWVRKHAVLIGSGNRNGRPATSPAAPSACRGW